MSGVGGGVGVGVGAGSQVSVHFVSFSILIQACIDEGSSSNEHN